MKNLLFVGVLTILLSACTGSDFLTSSSNGSSLNSIKVSDQEELNVALSKASPGDQVIMADGVWENLEIKISANGTASKPIVLKAETPGKVFIQGQSNLQLGGDFVIVEGLHFVNGYSPSRSVIQFALEDDVANHCIVRHCVIEDFNKLQRNFQDLWVVFKGRHNQLANCYLAGKSNRGPTIRVDLNGNENINNYHKIVNNHFGPRPPKGGPSAETIQIGNSYTSMCPSYTLIANNLFDRCNGEVEVISSKTNFNEIRNNVFYKSEGSVVTRHGNYCTVDGNYFIGDESNKIGGVRIIGTGHTISNNYFYNLRGEDFRSPLAVMNGIKKSPLNRYIQVTDVTIAYNSWINCSRPLQFGVGSNISQKDVLPASEIRSERPIRTTVANNLIYNSVGDDEPVVAHDELDGILFKSNVINNQSQAFENLEGLKTASFDLKEIAEYLWVPTAGFPQEEIYIGFEFEKLNKDLFGSSRKDRNSVGAISGQALSASAILDRSQYGPKWRVAIQKEAPSQTYSLKANQNIAEIIEQGNHGDVYELASGDYSISSPIKISNKITVKAALNATVKLHYDGPAQTPLFELQPKGELSLNGLELKGLDNQYAFAPLKENMSSLYNLKLENCTLENFDYVLKAYKYSFAEHIELSNSTFRNCANGLELSEETEDKGEYNAENISIDRCTFDNIQANVVDYYRGGYDESTVGGDLSITNSIFANSGAEEANGILLNTYGIINVNLSGNTFENNNVKQIALLWGAKNNKHSSNTIKNSGEIVVEENLKLKTFY